MIVRRRNLWVGAGAAVVWAGMLVLGLESRTGDLDTAMLLFIPTLLGGGALLLVGGTLAILGRTRVPLALGALLLILGTSAGFVSGRIHRAQIPRAEAAAVPVVEGIERFIAERGRPPATLDELVPGYLSSVPRCPYGVWGREYEYSENGETYGLWFDKGVMLRHVYVVEEGHWEGRD